MNVQLTHDKVDRLFEHYLQPGSPGCAVAVLKDGEIIYRQGYGLASLELGVPITPATVFNIGSMSKQFTAFAIALLEAEGRLSLDDDIHQYLPELHDFGETVAIRHLIYHTSGLRCTFPELLALAEWRDTDTTTTEDVCGLLQAQRELNFRPGDEYSYANSNYILLARICERVSGQTFAAFCQERIFDPLGMTHSVVNDSIVKLIPGRAMGYYNDEQGHWFNAPLTDSVVGPTNIYTTVEDLARWDENFYTGQIGGRALIERIEQPGRLNDGTELEYAFGLLAGPTHQYRGWQLVEHGGGQGGYGSWMMRFPELHLSVVVLFNHYLGQMQDDAFKVADLFLVDKATAGQPAVTPETTAPLEVSEVSADQLVKKAGKYFNARRAAIRDITYAEGRLRFGGYNLVPVSENRFFFEVEPQSWVEFVTAADGTVIRMRTRTSSGSYDYDRIETTTPTPGELAQYAGRYYSPELDVYWTFVAEADHLVAHRRKYVDSQLTPLFRDTFSDDWGPLMGYPTTYLVAFERDERGTITGLRVSGSRLRNLKFIKQRA